MTRELATAPVRQEQIENIEQHRTPNTFLCYNQKMTEMTKLTCATQRSHCCYVCNVFMRARLHVHTFGCIEVNTDPLAFLTLAHLAYALVFPNLLYLIYLGLSELSLYWDQYSVWSVSVLTLLTLVFVFKLLELLLFLLVFLLPPPLLHIKLPTTPPHPNKKKHLINNLQHSCFANANGDDPFLRNYPDVLV